MIIGICGGSGSGKTRLLGKLAERFKALNPAVFSMDNYYLPIEQQLKDKSGKVNFDLPSALDKNALVADLRKLCDGESIRIKEYHFNRLPENEVFITIEPSPLIIVEGLFLFEYPELHELIDISIFVVVDLQVQLERRLKRDTKTRHYSVDEITYQWNNHVLPCYTNYLLPYKEQAHFQFNNDDFANEELERLITFLTPQLNA